MADYELTKLGNLIDPEVMADMAQAKIEKAVTIIPYAVLNRDLVGNPGSTITVPRFTWDGIAVDVEEGDDIPIRSLGTEASEYTIKMAGIGTAITDKAVLSGYGNPVGAATTNIANSIVAKLDEDAHVELLKSKTVFNANSAVSYEKFVDAIGLFQAEGPVDMVALIHPDLITTLRKDANFIDKSKYGGNVMMNGEIGTIGDARLVRSRRAASVGGYYYTPIILTNDPLHNDDIPALTYYIKRDTNVEVERKSRNRTTEITADQFYVVALTNESKVVILKTTGANIAWEKMQEAIYTYPGLSVSLATTKVSGEVAITRTDETTWAAALKLKGKANAITSTETAELGFDNSTTHYVTGCLEIPGVGITDEAPAVTFNGTAVNASEMRKIGASWFMDFVYGLKAGANGPVFATGQTSFTIVANGVTTTVTPDLSGVELA